MFLTTSYGLILILQTNGYFFNLVALQEIWAFDITALLPLNSLILWCKFWTSHDFRLQIPITMCACFYVFIYTELRVYLAKADTAINKLFVLYWINDLVSFD